MHHFEIQYKTPDAMHWDLVSMPSKVTANNLCSVVRDIMDCLRWSSDHVITGDPRSLEVVKQCVEPFTVLRRCGEKLSWHPEDNPVEPTIRLPNDGELEGLLSMALSSMLNGWTVRGHDEQKLLYFITRTSDSLACPQLFKALTDMLCSVFCHRIDDGTVEGMVHWCLTESDFNLMRINKFY